MLVANQIAGQICLLTDYSDGFSVLLQRKSHSVAGQEGTRHLTLKTKKKTEKKRQDRGTLNCLVTRV